ncbi:hypothetical protein L1H33_004605, partial [Salmonella enterica]|nr:hypothetical protein [Salmonella enterica]
NESLKHEKLKTNTFITYNIQQNNFTKIPSCIICYWFTPELLSLFKKNKIGLKAKVGVGLQTGNNDKYIRNWFEVSYSKITFNAPEENAKWYPCNKGGGHRKWSGEHLDIINWENSGFDIKNHSKGAAIRNEKYYFKSCITWSRISSGSISFRYLDKGFVHNDASCFISLPSEES